MEFDNRNYHETSAELCDKWTRRHRFHANDHPPPGVSCLRLACTNLQVFFLHLTSFSVFFSETSKEEQNLDEFEPKLKTHSLQEGRQKKRNCSKNIRDNLQQFKLKFVSNYNNCNLHNKEKKTFFPHFFIASKSIIEHNGKVFSPAFCFFFIHI